MLRAINGPVGGDLNHFVVVVNLYEVVQNGIVVGAVLVVEFLYQIENVFHLVYITSWTNPELATGIFEAPSFDVLYLIDSEVTLLPPLQFFVEEVKHSHIEGPNVVSARQVDVVVRIERGKGDCSAEVGLATARKGLLGDLVEVALSKTKVDDIDAATFSTKYKVRGFDVPVDEATLVHLANAG
jgi:hypothetical protein